MSKPIGELQGWWAVSQKVLLVTWPLIVAWGAWTTRQAFAVDAAITNERIEARAYTDKCLAGALAGVYLELTNIKTQIAAIPTENPPPLWEKFVRDTIADHNARLNAIERKP